MRFKIAVYVVDEDPPLQDMKLVVIRNVILDPVIRPKYVLRSAPVITDLYYHALWPDLLIFPVNVPPECLLCADPVGMPPES